MPDSPEILAIRNNPEICAYKKEFLLHIFEHENQSVSLDNTTIFEQRLNYLHWNPVTAGFVEEPKHWMYGGTIYF